MSTPGENSSWNPQGNENDAQQPPQEPWARPPAPQDPYGQQAADPGQYGQRDPYGQQAADAGQYGQRDPHGQQHWSPAPGSGPSASDPYAPGSAPYGASSAPQAPAVGSSGTVPPGEPQSRLVVGLLGIFLGVFGVHRFLLGYTTIGIIQIVVSVFTCGLGGWWGLIEGIMVLAKAQAFERDAYGRPLRD